MTAVQNRRAMLVLIALSGLIISICMGLRQSLGLFMRPMTLELGISAATFGFSIALQNIVWGLSQPFVGAAADRYGPRPVLVATALVYAAGLLLMVFSNAFPGGLEVAGFLAGIGTAGTGFGVLIGTVSRATPPEKRSQTVGLVAAAGSLGTMVLAPVGPSLINGFGWKAAMVALGASALALIGLFNSIGTYMFGLLGARYSQKHLLAMIYLLRTLFIIAFLAAPISATSTLVFAAAMGFLWLGVAPLVTGIIGRVFGLTHFNTLYGVVFLSHQVGSFFGAWMGGLVFDRTGNYNFAWGALIVIGITAFTLQWLMDERPPRERKPAGPLAPAAA